MNQPTSGFGPGKHLDVVDDPIHDPYQAGLLLASPSVCGECGALYADGRWQWAAVPPRAATVTCPACLRIRDRQPAGTVAIDAALAAPNRAAILTLARDLEARATRAHPLQRIMAIEPSDGADGALRIETTDPHLARLLGEALEQTLHVQAGYAFARGAHLLRVDLKA